MDNRTDEFDRSIDSQCVTNFGSGTLRLVRDAGIEAYLMLKISSRSRKSSAIERAVHDEYDTTNAGQYISGLSLVRDGHATQPIERGWDTDMLREEHNER